MKEKFRALWEMTKYLHKFPLWLALSALFGMLTELFPLAILYLFPYAVFCPFTSSIPLLSSIFLLLSLILAGGMIPYFSAVVSHEVAYLILNRLRGLCYIKLDELAPAALVDDQSTVLTNTVMNDVTDLELFYAHTLPEFLAAAVLSCIYLGILLSIHWSFALIALCVMGSLIYCHALFLRCNLKNGENLSRISSQQSSLVQDSIQGLRDLLSYRAETKYLQKFQHNAREQEKITSRYTLQSHLAVITRTFVAAFGQLGMLAVVFVLFKENQLSGHNVMALFCLSFFLFRPLNAFLDHARNYDYAYGSVQRVLELLKRKPSVIDDGERTVSKNQAEFQLDLNDVTFAYPAAYEDLGTSSEHNVALLSGVNLSLRTGETLVIAGASGGGKTTLARLIQRFWNLSSGTITMNGVNIKELPLKELRTLITVVPQNCFFFCDTIRNNLLLAAPDASEEELYDAAKKANAHAFISELKHGYDTIIGSRGYGLSSGQKQRLALAQAFLKNSPILILDEASANLDAQNERLIQEALDKAKSGRICMIIAHRLSTLKTAERIAYLSHGKIIAEGKHSQLKKESREYSDLIVAYEK